MNLNFFASFKLKQTLLALYSLSFFLSFAQTNALISFSKDTLLMGAAFTITALHQNPVIAEKAVDAAIQEIVRIESSISSWQSSSQTSAINKNAGIKAVRVDKELFQLIQRSIKISEITEGYFDISFASMDKVWKFNGQEQDLPSTEELVASVQKIAYKNIQLDKTKSTVFLLNEGMKIGFGAIGKGFAADQAKKILLELGIENGVVNAGGDLLAWGNKQDGSAWRIGIADPNQKNEVLSSIEVRNQAVVTSGDYEKFVLIDGERFGHIINPKTGMPAKGIISVSVFAANAEIADALATSIFILGEKDGLALANHLKGVDCIIINDKNKMLYSKGIALNLWNDEE